MPEKNRGGQIALLIAGTLLVVLVLLFIFLGQSGREDRAKTTTVAAESTKTQQAEPSESSPKERVEEKLKRALAPQLAASDKYRYEYYAPPRSQTGIDEYGRVPAVTSFPADGEPAEIVEDYLQSNLPGSPLDLGWMPSDLSTPVVKNQVTSRHNGVTHLYLRQQVDGIEVYNGDLNANLAKDGSILSLNNGFVKDVRNQVNRRQPAISAAEAIRSAAEQVEAGAVVEPETLQPTKTPEGPALETVFDGGDVSFDPIPAKLVYVAQPGNVTRLAWNLVMHLKDGVRWLDLTIDAENGDLLTQANWYANADYRVFAIPKEHPTDGPRTLETDPHDPANSPFGWHDTNGTPGAEFNTTQGNNVHAQEDTDANNSGGRRPNGGPTLRFDNPLDLAQVPSTYEDAAITNLYYWNNVIHDILWHYGFDEASGNFQENNYGNGGIGSDHVWADAQDGSGTNNANFGTPADGSNPRMQMFVWTQANPDRDSDLENGIIIHEYGHGISNRLTGGAANSSALTQSQSRGMGEGWSDWWALCLTAVPGDTANTPRGIGTYVLGQSASGAGIRPFRYTTDTDVNPQTYGNLNDGGLSVPHGIGSVWCTILWEVYWELVGAHGWDPNFSTGSGGNNIAMQLVIDGMKLQGANPTYIAARNAIIQADQVNNGGANFDLLWQAFARRGMGFSATDGGGPGSLNVTEAFDVPDEAISVTDISVVETDSGSFNAVVTVSLDMASPDEEIRVNYATENGTAVAPGDFTAASGQLIFPANTTTRTFNVSINGDTTPEEDEIFTIRLSNPINGYIPDDTGIGTILNDDYIPPVITSPLTANGAEGIAFSYTITGDNTPREFSIGTGAPTGMSVNPTTGVISWPSPAIGVHTFDITATNPVGSDTKSLQITIDENPLLTALDVTGVTITTSAIPWFHQTATTHDGVDAAQSGDVNDNQNSWMEVSVAGPETVSFWWKVSSEGGWDYLKLFVNGALNQQISGTVDWQRVELTLPAGSHTLRWDYDKDGSVSSGADTGWVDELVLQSQDPRPIITSELTAIGAKDQSFSYQIETSKPATSFSSGTLPAGLGINPSTGLISGTPTVGGTTDVSITATNGGGSDTQTLRIVITEVATFPFYDGFEGGPTIAPVWTVTGTNEFRTQATMANGPQAGSWHLVMDDNLNGGDYSRNEVTLTIDLAGRSGVALGFWAKDFSDEPHGPPPIPFVGSADFDGVAISEDGTNWYEVQGLRSEITGTWEKFQVNLDDAIATHGLAYNSAFRIRFNQYDNFSAPTDGIAIDEVRVASAMGRPDLDPGSDSGASNTDDLTNDVTPTFLGTGFPGAAIELVSDKDGTVGTGTVSGAGNWSLTVSTLVEGLHEITVSEIGGIPSPPLDLTIDATGPLPAVNQAAGQADATSDPILDFSVVFDEPVPTFNESHLVKGGSLGAISNATANEMPPNDGTTYNVEITGMPNDGYVTLSVDAGIAMDIAGNVSQASVSTDNLINYRILADTPTGVSASDEGFSDKIQVTWDPVPEADGGYRVYRNTVDDFSSAAQIGNTLAGNTILNDTTTITGTTYYYWVQSRRKFTEELSPESASDAGVRAADEDGDDSGSATDLGIPGSGDLTQTGTLGPADKDFFKFELEWRAHTIIYTTGLLDTEGTLLESDGTTPINDTLEDDDARPDGHNFEIDEVLDAGVYYVKVAGAGNNQSGQYDLMLEIFGPLAFQPDHQVGKSPAGLLGDDVYSEFGVGQTQMIVSKKLKPATFHGRVENDGNFADELTMRGTRGTRLFKTIYYNDSGNVTAAMVAGTLTQTYEDGEGEATRIKVKPSRKLKNSRNKKIKRKKFTAVVTATSGMEGTQIDVVKAITRTK